MRRVIVLVSVLLGLQGCLASDGAEPAAGGDQVVAGTGVSVHPTTGSQTGHAVAWDGTNYLVVWSDARANSGFDVYAARVSPAGALLDASPIPVCKDSGDQVRPDVAFDGTNYLVVWQDHRIAGDRNVHAARVSRAGAVLDTRSLAIAQPGHQIGPVVAFDGTSYLVAWEDQRELTSDVWAARVSPAGALLGAFPLSTAGGHQVQPALACAGATCLVAWRDARNGGPDVYGTRVGASGLLDPAGLPISLASASQGAPAVGADGNQFLVAWSDKRTGTSDVYGTRVTAAGAVLDPGGRAISTAPGPQQEVAVAFEGAYFLVVWEDGRSGTQYDVFGARVDAGAAVLDPGGFLVEARTAGTDVAIASDRDGRALVASDPSEVVNAVLGTTVSRVVARALTSRAVLAVSRSGGGTGTVRSTPAGIDCGALCSALFDAPTDVNLTPVASADSVFVAWSGACAGSGACTVTVDGPRAVDAEFALAQPLTVIRTGSAGTVVSTPAGMSCGGSCTAKFVEGTTVELRPVAGVNSLFKSWFGPCRNVRLMIYDPLWLYGAPRCELLMTEPRTVTAEFAAAYNLAVRVSGTAPGQVDAAGGYWPIHCASGSSASCSSLVPSGETVVLVATPGPDAILKSWSGCTTASGLECRATVTAVKTVTATFQPATYPLAVVVSGSGTVTGTGTGISCGAGSAGDCGEAVANGATVTLTATPAADAIFKSWSGCTSVSGTTCTLSMTAARTARATFQPATYPLAVVVSGVGRVSGTGIACATGSSGDCAEAVTNGGTATLTATPEAGSLFKSWSGCTSVSGTTCTVSMTAARTVRATFQPSTYPLTTTVTGSGTVEGPGISCTAGSAGDCTEAIANGATVALTATPDVGAIFKYWSGCTSVSGATCTVSMTAARTVKATFQPSTYPLTTTVTGSGSVIGPGIACATGSTGDCSEAVANGATVTLTAIPDADALFKSWSGCTSVSGTTCTVKMTGAKTVKATFQPSTYVLTTTVTGAGTVAGEGIACATGSTGDCSQAVPNGGTVALTAIPDADSLFKYWSGCTSVSGTTCTVAMTAAKTVRATFQPSTYVLTATVTGVGTVSGGGITCTTGSAGDCSEAVPNGATATLTATPDADSLFKYWSGCTSVSGTTCTVTMTAARTVRATFQPTTYPLTTTVTGAGTVSGDGIACTTGSTGDCSEAVANGATTTLTATPDADSIFKYWSGCSSASGTTCNVTMTAARTVRATFQPSTFPLAVRISGAGTVEGPGITCTTGGGGDCAEAIANGASVTLVATPPAGVLFRGWVGCSAVSGTSCTVTMTGARTVTANF